MAGIWHDAARETPLSEMPPDYYPEGCGSWFEIPDGRDAGKRLFVRDSVHVDGRTEPARTADVGETETVVLVHGNPESSYTYRNVVDKLTSRIETPLRIVAMDHVGFGLSDTAEYELVCQDHARNLRHLLDALDLSDVTLVVHDWGGPIGVGAFLDREAVSNFVVLNSTVFPMPDDGYTYHRNYPSRMLPWSRVPDVIPAALWGDLAAYVPFLAPSGPVGVYGGLGKFTLGRQVGCADESDPHAQQVYADQFRDRGNVRSSKRLVRQTPTWGHGSTFRDPDLGERDTRPFYSDIHDRLGEAWGPDGQDIGVRAVVGRWDPCGKPSVLDQWREALPQLEGNVTAFPEEGHFIEEARPDEVATAIEAELDS